MTFIKYKTGLIMSLLVFMLSGCGNYDNPDVNNSQSSAAEQSHIEDEETIIRRARIVRGNMDDYYEKVDTESKLKINDILDSENEFLVSGEWDMRIIYIYLLSDKGYEKYIFAVNYSEQESVKIHLQDNITEMYVLCPEYTNVEAATKTDSSTTKEYSLYVVDEEGHVEEVGGSPRYRIFSVDVSVRENIGFELCNSLESNDDRSYGGFEIQFE